VPVQGGSSYEFASCFNYRCTDRYPAVVQIRGHVAFYPERVDEVAEHVPT
jgi:uncharacterized protein (DUF427 family)